MKRYVTILCAIAVVLMCATPSVSAEGTVTYSSDAGKFIFAPGSEYSPTDLFPNFKDVMPGDSILQPITVKNDISNNCKVKIYMRALGAHADSVEFLSQLGLTVVKESDTVMFDAPADQAAQLDDWVYLGTLYSGGECDLMVMLDVPVTLDNQFKNLVGYLDWEFAVEELPIDPSDPEPPKTGDDSQLFFWVAMFVTSLSMAFFMIFLYKRKMENE